MKGSLQKITLAFIVIALLPIAFIVYQLNSLNKNEEVVREIYQRQLEYILYSVNQYSDDIINSWSNRIIRSVTGDNSKGQINNFFGEQKAVRHILLTDLKGKTWFLQADSTEENSSIRAEVEQVLGAKQKSIERLITYDEAGFKKMEPMDTIVRGSKPFIPVAFAIGKDRSEFQIAVMIIDLRSFIFYTLGPKMQGIAQDKFIISVFRESDNALVYSTESVNAAGSKTIRNEIRKEGQKTDLWLLPGHYLGIALKDATIDDLVKTRTQTSTFILTLITLLLAGGILFVYRNIRKEIALSQAKSQFVSNVSHEIRTPLSLISMYAETLEMNRVSEEKKKEYYSIIVKETARLAKLVNRILNFSQADADKKKYVMQPVQLNELCNEVLESYSFHLQEAGFKLEFNPEVNLPKINADRDSVLEAVINLVDNAMKYSRDEKHIIVNTRSGKKEVLVEIIDHGIGIPKNQHTSIFEQFHRVPSGDVHNTKGSGLGLTLVKKTMEAHHGKVKVESVLGKGSRFQLHFPINEIVKNETSNFNR